MREAIKDQTESEIVGLTIKLGVAKAMQIADERLWVLAKASHF